MINDRFEIIKKIGEGRSKVFLCVDHFAPELLFAMKVLPNQSADKEKAAFIEEFRLLRRLMHPNIITVFEIGVVCSLGADYKEEFEISEDDMFFTLEYFEGQELTYFINRMNQEKLLSLIQQISNVLYYLHLGNYVYFDLKPENLLVKERENSFEIKFIDFGFAEYFPQRSVGANRGTPQYIAPEIIKHETVDHRADLYSLGIMLYEIVFGVLPFNETDHLDIYKAHIKGDFIYPQSDYSEEIIQSIKKLLHKNPEERFHSVISLMDYLNIDYQYELATAASMITQVILRHDETEKIKEYLTNEFNGEILSISGREGIGKSTLLELLHSNGNDFIFINRSTNNSQPFWKILLYNLLYTKLLYNKVDDSLKKYITLHLRPEAQNFLSELKSIFSKITRLGRFTIIIDDVDSLNNLNLEILENILPVLLANSIKVIIAAHEKSEVLFNTELNIRKFPVRTLNDNEIDKIIDQSFAEYFPKKKFRELVKKFCDNTPGNIEKLYKDLIHLSIIKFDVSAPLILFDENTSIQLKNSLDHIHNSIYENLTDNEKYIAGVISALNIPAVPNTISDIIGMESEEAYSVLESLQQKNIFVRQNLSVFLRFTSQTLKEFVYNSITDKKKIHQMLSSWLDKHYEQYDTHEYIYQLQASGREKDAFNIILSESEKAEKSFFFSYAKQILLLADKLNLTLSERIEYKYRLCKILLNLGDANSCSLVLNELLNYELSDELRHRVRLVKAKVLAQMGELDGSLLMLHSEEERCVDSEEYTWLQLEKAGIYLDLNKFERVREICSELLNGKAQNNLIKGKTYNLLGLESFYADNNLENSVNYFIRALNCYEQENDLALISGMQVNIGNIYNIMGNYNQSLHYWNKALQINNSVGNIGQEARLNMNLGIYYSDQGNYEKAISNYDRAYQIFSATGNKISQGLVMSNLAESFMAIGGYQSAFQKLTQAAKLFTDLNKTDEKFEVDFLFCKLFYLLDYEEGLKNKLSQMRNMIYAKPEFANSYKLDYASLFLIILRRNKDELIDRIPSVLDRIFDNEDLQSYYELQFLQIEFLVELKDFHKAFELINKLENKNRFLDRIFPRAKIEYLLGKIAREIQTDKLEPSINYLLNGLKIIENESLSELTLQILLGVSMEFAERGNYKKAEYHYVYAERLLSFFVNNITDDELKGIYLNSRKYLEYQQDLNSLKHFLSSEAK